LSNLFKSSFVTFKPEDKKVIKINQEDPRIINADMYKNDKDNKVKKQASEDVLKIKEQILSEASEEAKAILEEARLEAQSLKEKAITDGENKGYQLGYDKGYSEGNEEVKKTLEQIEQDKRTHELEYKKILESLEPKYASLMIQLLEKVTGVLLEEKQDIILYLINQGLQSKDRSNNYTIYVSADDYDYVLGNKEKLDNHHNSNIQTDILSDSKLSKGQCYIETETGIINSSIDTQLSELALDIKLIAKV
jgi:flagellar assembly protein FliH